MHGLCFLFFYQCACRTSGMFVDDLADNLKLQCYLSFHLQTYSYEAIDVVTNYGGKFKTQLQLYTFLSRSMHRKSSSEIYALMDLLRNCCWWLCLSTGAQEFPQKKPSTVFCLQNGSHFTAEFICGIRGKMPAVNTMVTSRQL